MKKISIKNGILRAFYTESPIEKKLENIAKQNGVKTYHIVENLKLKEKNCTEKITLINKNSGNEIKVVIGYRIFDNNFGYPKKEMEYNFFYITPDKEKKVTINEYLSKTSKGVYWDNYLVIGVNPNTLEYLGGGYFKDDKTIYYQGILVEGINFSKAKVVGENKNIIIDDKYIFIKGKKSQKLCKDFKGLGYSLYFNNGKIFDIFNYGLIYEGVDINNLRLVDYKKIKHYLSEYIIRDYFPDYQELMPDVLTDGYNFYLHIYYYTDEKTNNIVYKIVKIFDRNTSKVQFIDSYTLRIGNEIYSIDDEFENRTKEYHNIDIPTFERHGEYYFNSFFAFIFRTNNVMHVFKDKNGMLVYSGKETYLKPLGFFHKILIKLLGKYF